MEIEIVSNTKLRELVQTRIKVLLLSFPPVAWNNKAIRVCLKLLKLTDRHFESHLETACKKAMSYTTRPSYKSIKNILAMGTKKVLIIDTNKPTKYNYSVTRGANYYGGRDHDK